MTATTRTIDLPTGLTLTVDEYGRPADGRSSVLILHGGGGPRTVAGLAAALGERGHVIAPVHPGFDGTARPEWADSIPDLASIHLDLIDTLDLDDVLVVGSSIGGWIAAEMGLRDNHERLGGLVLINAVGIRPDQGGEITDIRMLTPAQLGELSFVNPALRFDPSTLTEQQLAGMAVNQRTLNVYAGDPYMHDPKLLGRLHRVSLPTLVIWGEQDGVAPLGYGRAYAGAFPHSRFVPVAQAGHLPHIEQPALVLAALADFVAAELPVAVA